MKLISLIGLVVNASVAVAADVRTMDVGERTIDLSHVTVDSFAKAIGNEPETAFSFVRDTIAYEPYIGCLRGGRGTLVALAGNSLDRAILLKALFERNGFQTRLMRGELGEAQTRRLCETLFPGAGSQPPKPPTRDGNPPKNPPPAVTAFQAIYAELASSKSLEEPEKLSDIVARESAQHFWLQYKAGDKWIDADPMVPEAKLGDVFAANGRPDEAAPRTLAFKLRFQILGIRPDEHSPRSLFQWQGDSATLAGDALVICHGSPTAKKAGSVVGAGSGLLGAQETPNSLCPIVTIAGRAKRGTPFSVGARENSEATATPGKRLGLDLFKQKPADGKPIAREWIEFEITPPGKAAEKIERTLFAGDELRTAEQVKSRIFVASVITGAPDARHFLNVKAGPKPPRPDSQFRRVLRATNLLLASGLRNHAAGLQLSKGYALRFLVDSPQIVICDFEGSRNGLSIRGDLRKFSPAVIASFDQSPLGRAATRLMRGIVDTAAESAVFQRFFGAPPGSASEPAAADLLLRGKEARPVGKLSADDLERITGRRELGDVARGQSARGFLFLGPDSSTKIDGRDRYAWWKIDSRTGAAIGVMDTGLNQTGTEVSETDAEVAAEDEAVAVETEPRVVAWSEKEAETIANKLGGGGKLPADAPVSAADPGGPIPYNPPPGDRGVIPMEYPPDHYDSGKESVSTLLNWYQYDQGGPYY